MDLTKTAVSTALNSTSHLSGPLAGRGVFTLFRLPLVRGQIRPAERDLAGTAEVGSVTVNGKSAVTYRWGDGTRPVLFVHGWQSRGVRCVDLVPLLLDRGYSVIAFDAPGHGQGTGRSTTILEYREIIKELWSQYGDFEAVVAHSFGVLAAFFAMNSGVRAERIVAVSGVSDFDYLVDQFAVQLSLRGALKTRLRASIETRLFPGEPDIWTRFSALNRPERITAPILVVHDEDDDMVALDQAHRIAGAYGDQARLVVTKGLGHRRILGDPQVLDKVVGFVQSGRIDEAEIREVAS